MNILFIESSIPPYRGGIQRVSWLLRNYFLKYNNDVFFAFYLKDSDEVDSLHKLRYDNHSDETILYPLFKNYIVSNHIDIVMIQGHCGKPLLDALHQIRNALAIKLIGCFHVSPDFEKYRKVPLKTQVKNAVKKLLRIPLYNSHRHFYEVVDKFVLLSETFIDDMCQTYQLLDRNKIVCIPNPLSFDESIDNDQILKKEKIVLIVTRLEETQKNIMSALRIWKEVEKKGDLKGWKLVLGGYGPDEKKILQYADSLSLQHYEFIGKVDDAQTLFKKASIFMMSSRYEGFGMTLTEALQNACVPMAFDNFSVLHDILTDGENGYIIPSGNETYYAKRLLSLMSNDQTRMEMAIRGLESSNKFSIDNVGNKWLELFNSLMI